MKITKILKELIKDNEDKKIEIYKHNCPRCCNKPMILKTGYCVTLVSLWFQCSKCHKFGVVKL